MKWWTVVAPICLSAVLIVAALLGKVTDAVSLAVWGMIGFICMGSLSLFVVYAFVPIARPIVQKHVMLLAMSYTLFSLAPLLHGLGLWQHDVSAVLLWDHFGVPGFCLLTVACSTGFIGLILAAQAIEERLRSGVGNDAESLPTSK